MALARVPEEIIQQIKEKNDIVDVISEYVDLKDMGSVYQGRCPFPDHRDTYPSFTVNVAEQFFYCFGCGKGSKKEGSAGSDVIAFIQEIEQVDFQEACKILAERVNIPFNLEQNSALEKKKDKLTAKNREWFGSLQSHPTALGYLERHGVNSREALQLGRFGIVPIDLGGDNASPFEKMIRGRLSVGIPEMSRTSRRPKTVAMAYRALDGSVPKWINDPNSDLWSKGETLYLYSQAHRPIRKNNFAVVVEGYLDAIALHAKGVPEGVAIMGRIFTEKQMDALRKDTDTIILWPDGDNPGITWAKESLAALYERGFKVLIICTPDLDPDDVIKDKDDARTWIKANAQPALNYFIDLAAVEYELKTSQLRVNALNELLPIVESCKLTGDQAVARDMIERRFQVRL